MPHCRLCHSEIELRNSHIVPEFLYDDMYNDKHQVIGIHGVGSRGYQVIQKGIREPLFCEFCEQHFNEYFEKPFLRQWINCPLPDLWCDLDDVCSARFEYETFKLFHLSVLFRAAVSSLPTFANVSLGSHEEKLRQILVGRNCGDWWQYPIMGCAVVHPETKRLVQIVTRPSLTTLNGQRCYGMMYGGVHWWISVSSHRNRDFESNGLQPDGCMRFCAIPWNEIPEVQFAASALRQAERRQAANLKTMFRGLKQH